MLPRLSFFFLFGTLALVGCGSSDDVVSAGDTGGGDTTVDAPVDTAKDDTAKDDTAKDDTAKDDTAKDAIADGVVVDTATEAAVDAATDAATDTAVDVAADAAADAASCGGDGDCRKFSSYCDVCACLPLGKTDPDPVCHGTTISCFVDPCNGKSAACVGGKCVIR